MWGIGKGYAADMAVAAMRKAGATAGVVALSGDIKTFGRLPGHEKFVFGIRHPRREDACWHLLISRMKRFPRPATMSGILNGMESDTIIFSIRRRYARHRIVKA